MHELGGRSCRSSSLLYPYMRWAAWLVKTTRPSASHSAMPMVLASMMERIRLWFSRRYCSCFFDSVRSVRMPWKWLTLPSMDLRTYVSSRMYLRSPALVTMRYSWMNMGVSQEMNRISSQRTRSLSSGWTRSVNDILLEVSSVAL